MSRPVASQGNAELSVDASDLLKLSRALKSLDDKTVLKSLRAGLREAAKPIADEARRNAAFSRSIPKAITVETAFTAKKSGVFIAAKRNKMPTGKEPLPGLYERGQRGSRGGSWRHPVFGDRDRWVTQQGHPFLAPALRGKEASVEQAVRDAIETAVRAAGLAID